MDEPEGVGGEVCEGRRLPGREECERERLSEEDEEEELRDRWGRSEVVGAKERLRTESR